MKNFFKENISLIVRILIDQLAMAIFGLVLAMACQKSDMLLTLSSLLAIGFYLYLLYFMTYEVGQKDGIRINAGRLHYKPMRGFLVGLCANVPNLVLGILAIIGKASINGAGFFEKIAGMSAEKYATLAPAWALEMYGVCSSVAEVIQCMYKGVALTLFNGNILTLLFMPLPAIIVCGVSYVLGVRYSDGFLKKSSDKAGRYK